MLDSGASIVFTMGASMAVRAPSLVGPVTHLTSPEAYEAILNSQRIGSSAGIFGIQTAQVPNSTLGRFMLTMVPGNLSKQIILSGDAASSFTAPKPVGPFSLFRNLAGVRNTPLGSIDLVTGEFIQGEVMVNGEFRPATVLDQAYYMGHQAILDYGIDVGLYSIRMGQGYVSGVNSPEPNQILSKH